MKKYIHYCWFGDKEKPKMLSKCIDSWEKFLPDFEIKLWTEKDINLDECPFVKDAYAKKKWAFVADYARAKILYENGGIYFDVDMEVTKSINDLLNEETFLGVEDSGKVACGVWWAKNEKSFLAKELLEFYQSLEGFDETNMYNYSIPRILSSILSKCGLENRNKKEIQRLEHGIIIYPREYFYPLSYDRQNNIFTDETRMIHYYDASWIPKWEQREIKIYRKFGRDKGAKIISTIRTVKKLTKNSIKLLVYPIILYIRKKKRQEYHNQISNQILEQIKLATGKSVVAIHNSDWIGTSYATKETFNNTIGIGAISNFELIPKIASEIIKKDFKLIIFSAFTEGWYELIEELKKQNSNIRIKVLWHGDNSMHIEYYDWSMFNNVFKLLEEKHIESIGFVKKTMYELYKAKGYNVEFLLNNVNIKRSKATEKKESVDIKVGMYASGDRWVKNFYNQLAGVSLVENVRVDCIPLSNKTKIYADMLNMTIFGMEKPVPREELLKKLASNDINIYVTMMECAPLLPLESLELGVPCITGNNHHYWEGTDLEEYLIVKRVDDPFEIKEKINLCLNNKDKIITLYKEWKKEYNKKSNQSIKNFTK